MKGKMKRFLSLMLAIMLVFGMVPMDAYATEGTGDEIKIEDNTGSGVNVDEAVAAVQAKMDALADMPADTEAGIDALRAAYAETSEAFNVLTEEQQKQIDLACFNEAKAKIDAFDEAKAGESEGEGDDASVPAVTSEEGGDAAATPTYVAQIDGTQYTTLEAAVAAAGKNDTITVLTDVELTDTLTISAGKRVTLNLNGKTISQSKECTASYEMINNQGNLTITGNGKISFTDTGAGDPTFGWGSYTIRNEGTLVVENGTVEHLGQQNNGSVQHMYCAIFQYSGSTTIKGGTISTPTYRSVRLWKGDMTITGGTFEGQVWVQCVDDSAKLTIEGGTFAPRGVDGSSVFVGNVTDTGVLKNSEFKVTGGKFETKIGASDVNAIAGAITGGTFTEAAKSNTSGVLLAEGFALVKNAEGDYCVGELPEAEDKLPEAKVTKEDPIKLAIGDYRVWQLGTGFVSGENTIERPLDIVVNFEATETAEEAQAGKYGEWIADFYVTVTGFKGETLDPKDCYLAGNYGDWGWIVIPMDGATIEKGKPNAIVAAHDAKLTYKEICGTVEDFTAAIHISDEIIDANPELKIELALKLKDPQGTSEPQTIGEPIIYTVEDLRGEDPETEDKLPEAKVTKKDPIKLAVGGYRVWQLGTGFVSGENTIERPLDIVVNFEATETAEEAQAGKYGEWIADFYVTVTGFEGETLDPKDCYLAGNYGDWGWIVIPMDGATIEKGKPNAIVAAHDAKLTYKEICGTVEDFTAAIHISDDIIKENPDLEIKLELKLKDPTGELYTIGDTIIYTVADLRQPVAKIGEENYATLEAAFAAANNGEIVTLLANVETEESYTINKKVVLDLNGKTITGTDKATNSFGLINIQPGAELTINDTAGDGKITLKAKNDRGWNAYSSVISNQRGKLIVNGGTIEHLGGTAMAYAIDNLTNGTGTYAETVINGGTIKSLYRAIRQFLNGVEAHNILTVNGGTIEGTKKAIWMQDPSANANSGKLTVEANAVLKGDVYLDAETGTTEWPVEVSVAKAAFAGESTVITDEDTPYGYKVVDADGVFVVKCEKLLGKGTEEEPYLIKSVDDLILFRDSVNAGETVYNADGVYVALDDNVNLKGLDWSVNIGDDANNTFDGIFDGKGYSISNLTSTETAAKSDGYICTGLFGAIGGNAVIKNLTINNVAIDAGEYTGNVVGSVVGFAYESAGTIENVRVTGNISIKGADATSVGAIVGYAYDGSLTIKDCTVDGNTGSAITATSYVGGIVGYGGGQITVDNCTVQDIDVTANSAAAGGIAGILCGGKATNNTVKNVNVKANHVNWLNSAGIVVGSISAASTVSGTTFSNVTANDAATTTLVGSGHAEHPATPVGKVEATIGNVYYPTIQKAVNVAKAGDIVTVIDDIEIAAPITVPAGRTVTLDLNSKTVTGVPTESKAYAVIENKGDLTITGGGAVVCDHKLAGSTAYAVNTITNCGTLTIDGVTVENKSTANSQIGYAIDNNSTTANAIAVIKAGEVKASGSNYYDAIRQFCNSETHENSVTVEGGKVSSIWMQNPSDGNTEKNTKDVKGSVAISGGNVRGLYLEPSTAFTAAITGGHTGEVSYFQTAEGRNLEGFISGGTFGADYTSFCAKGFACEVSGTDEEGNEIYGIVELSCVAVINEEEYYTLSAAFEAAESGDTITVIENVNITDTITVPAGKTVTLDLNGKTVAYTTDVNDADMIRNSGDLTIIDSSDAENGKLVFNYTGAANERSTSTIVNLPGSTLTVKTGTVENASAANGSYNYAIDSQTNGTLGTVTVNVEGGTVKSNYMAIRQFNNGEACANTLNVTGGTIEATRRAIQVHLKNNGAYTNISGGTIKGGDFSLCFLTTSENLLVTGGKFEGAVWYSGTDGFISGGTFDAPVSAGYCAEGYIPTTNTDGTYGVKEGEFVALNNNTSVEYATVEEALAIANSGDTVILGKNATEVGVLAVTNGITLDLNGNTLSANYVVAFGDADIVDNSADKTGVLKVDDNMFSIAADNAQMPVYDGDNGGYRFATMGMQQVKIDSVDSDSFKLRFKPSFGDVIAKLLADGAADNQVNIMITLSWTNSDGTLGSQEFIYPEDLIRNVYYDGSKNAFSFSCKGLGAMGLANKVKVRFSVVSNRGVHATSEEIDPWNK